MARLLGPDAGSRLAYTLVGTLVRGVPGETAVVYADPAGTTLADLAVYNGTGTPGGTIPNSTLTVDQYSQLPQFWFPDGADTVYVTVNGGPLWPVDAIPQTGGTVDLSGYATLNGSSLVEQDPASKGLANGVAGLGADGKVPAGQLPASATGDFIPTADKAAPSGVATLDSSSLVVQLPAGRGAVNGVASLDGTTKVPTGQIPDLSSTYIPVTQKAANSGVASLNSSGLVVQNPATAYIPAAEKAAASGVPSLNSSSQVVQLPAGRAAANGVASLDAATKVPAAQLPDLSATYIATTQKAAASGVASLNGSSLVVQDPASKAQASGLASLNASSKVVQDPASAGQASGLATLNGSSLVVQDPASKAQPSGLASLNGSSLVVQEPASKAQASGLASLNASSLVVQDPASKGAANGVASLDAGTKVPVAQIPDLSATYLTAVQKAAASGVASLGADGKVPAGQLPAGGITLNVKDFGALGDGATNDSTAIAAAITALPTAGGTIYFPRGTYMARFTVTKNNCRLLGDGPGSVIKKNSAGTLVDTGSVSRFTAESLYFDGNGATYTGDGISIGGIHHRLTNIEVEATAGYCVTFPTGGAGHSGMVSDSIFAPYLAQLGQANETQAAIFLPDDNAVGQAPNRSFVGCHFNATIGYNDAGSENTKWVNCTMRNVTTSGQPRKLLMTGCRIATSGAAVSINAFQSSFVGCAWAGDVTLDGNQIQYTGNVLGNLILAAGLISSKIVGNGVNTTITDNSAVTAGNVLLGNDLNGYEVYRVAANSTTAWRWKNAAGGDVMIINTSNGRVGVSVAPTSTLHVGGAISTPVRTVTATPDTIGQSDSVILVNLATAVINLPSAVGIGGRRYTVKKVNSGAGSVTVTPNGVQTIDGAATAVLSTQWSRVEVVSDNANWQVVT